jgi:hypothetical protein
VNSSAIFAPPESHPAAHGMRRRAIFAVHSLAEPSSSRSEPRTISASVSTGMTAPAKIQVTSCTLVDKLLVAAE